MAVAGVLAGRWQVGVSALKSTLVQARVRRDNARTLPSTRSARPQAR